MEGMNMRGKMALVTGGGRGIGRAIAASFAAAGATVAILARSDDEVQATATTISACGGRGIPFVADVTDLDAMQRVVGELRDNHGPVDVLVNNAGVADPQGAFWDVDLDAWWRVHEINVRGVAVTTRLVLPDMIARRAGRIISIGSDIAERPTTRNLAYASSKAAVLRFTENLALATRPHGLAVFAVSPGMVRTRLTEARWRSSEASEIDRQQSSTEWSPPELVAQLVLELAQGRADELTGRYIHARKDSVDQMLSRVDEIRRRDLYTMKLRRLSDLNSA
jgi:NAD(P)-dependent dehydrogenase (short-subunit alcohol dehydrogenase family)